MIDAEELSMSLLRKSLLLLWGRCCTKVVIPFSAPSAGMPFQPKNSIIGDSLKKCSRKPILPSNCYFSCPSAGKPFQPKNSIIGGTLKRCSRKSFLPIKLIFFRPKRWKAISAQEFNNRGPPKKVLQEVIFTYRIDIFLPQALECHFSLRIQ